MFLTITGASGFVGRHLLAQYPAEQNSVVVLARKNPGFNPLYQFGAWDPMREEPSKELLTRSKAVIHLAGESVSQRWTPDVKRRIRDSRVLGTRNLVAGLSKLQHRPEVLVSASAIGFYGNGGDTLLKEDARIGQGFLAEVCDEWEHEAMKAKALGMRVVLLRLGIVLGTDGGALAAMAPLFRWGLGGRLGNGMQWMSWIHIQDLVRMIDYAVKEPKMAGIVNAVSPEPIRNAHFTQLLAKALHRPAIFPPRSSGWNWSMARWPRCCLTANGLFHEQRWTRASSFFSAASRSAGCAVSPRCDCVAGLADRGASRKLNWSWSALATWVQNSFNCA